jgi:hypothetical protein
MYPRWFDPENRGLVKWMVGDKTWRWANGATLKLRYAEAPDDWTQYQGHEYGWIGWDELTTWPTPELYSKLKATLRSSKPEVKFKRIRATANPGGVGHNWVKSYFGIDRYREGGVILMPEDGSNMRRLFVKARVTDNKILLDAQPDYAQQLRGSGSADLVKAWLDGDWDAVQGAYFSEFGEQHVIEPVQIPHTWTKIRCMDWGSSAPFAVYWAAVSDGQPLSDHRVYPKGALVVYKEWYGAFAANSGGWLGLKLTAEEVGEGIVLRDKEDEISDSVIDPAAWSQNGGPSIAERMARATDYKVFFRRGDNKRIPGWDLVRERLKGMKGEGPKGGSAPMIYFTTDCPHIIRTLPALTHDDVKMEDVDTTGEDHGPDAIRYLCMSRPWVNVPEQDKNEKPQGVILDELWQDHEASLQRRKRV